MSGTTSGTATHANQRNDERNAERCKPAPVLAFQWNDPRNDDRISRPFRSTTSLEVERRNGWNDAPRYFPSHPRGGYEAAARPR